MSVAACQACRVAFDSAEDQRDHYKGEFHRFNLKRKMVHLKPVTMEQFDQHQQKAEAEARRGAQGQNEQLLCRVCPGKRFATRATFEQHAKSKQHLKQAAKVRNAQASAAGDDAAELAEDMKRADVVDVDVNVDDDDDVDIADDNENAPEIVATAGAAPVLVDESSVPVVQLKQSAANASTRLSAARPVLAGSSVPLENLPVSVDGLEDAQTAALTPEQEEEEIERLIVERIRTAPRLPLTACLFCPKILEGTGDNFEHMAEAHSFFIPALERLVDAEGLLKYLGEKVAVGYECLECNGRGRAFQSLEAVRTHMIEKSHCRLDWFGNEQEYLEYYDYTLGDGEEPKPTIVDLEPGISLTLSNGKELGHRDLNVYYKQNYRPTDDRRAIISAKAHDKKGELNMHLAGRYKALGWSGGSGSSSGAMTISPHLRKEMVSRFQRASRADQRRQQKHSQRLGVHQNGLQKHKLDYTKGLL